MGICFVFVIEVYDSCGNCFFFGGVLFFLGICMVLNELYLGEIVDFGNGTYEVSYFVRVFGYYELLFVILGEEFVIKGLCEFGKVVVVGCELVGDVGLDFEVGFFGRYSIIRYDVYGNRVLTR